MRRRFIRDSTEALFLNGRERAYDFLIEVKNIRPRFDLLSVMEAEKHTIYFNLKRIPSEEHFLMDAKRRTIFC